MRAIVRQPLETKLPVTGPWKATGRLTSVEAITAFAIASAEACAIPLAIPCQVLLMAAFARKVPTLTSVPVPSASCAPTSTIPLPSLAMGVGSTC